MNPNDDNVIRSFCQEQRELLQLELQSETQPEEAKAATDDELRRSNVLHRLQVEDVSVGLYGRTVVRLITTAQQSSLLPAHRFTTGDEVEIRSQAKEAAGGVISEVTDESIAVALFAAPNGRDDSEEYFGSDPLSLLPKSSVEVHKKLIQALEELERQGTDHPAAGSVIRDVFSRRNDKANSTARSIPQPMDPINPNLDESQKEAVQFALHQTVALLHGPPGSGKTTTVVELIRQAVQKQKYRVLVTAPSNVAVDNILSRLVADQTKHNRLRVVRLGHPARLQAEILPYSLENLVQTADGTEIVSDVRKELQSWLRLASNPRTRYSDRTTARREMKTLRKEIRDREQKVVTDLLQRAQVVLATCVGAANRLLKDTLFDLVVIDEAAQSLEAACWIPILRGRRLVLAGDHCQLPPTIKCNLKRVQEGLGHTMFARIMKLYENYPQAVSRMLRVQYRMHESIADWASQALYHGLLQTHESAHGRTLATLPRLASGKEDEELATMPLLYIDTAGCDCYESTNAAGSRYNDGEAQIVKHHVERLLAMGIAANQIAVITPYNGQVELLKSLGMPVEVRTVDGFQGGEREAIILSLVRSSPGKRSIGFLRDERRLNVGVTRSRRHCCVVADSETVSQSPFVKNLLEWIEEEGEYRSAMDYTGETETQLNDDLEQAQLELAKMVLQDKPKTNRSGDDSKGSTKKAKAAETAVKRQAELDGLLDTVRNFWKNGKVGDELALSTQLSRSERKHVHELCEELGLWHTSLGIEGVDRRVILRIPDDGSPDADDEAMQSDTHTQANLQETVATPPTQRNTEPGDNDQDEIEDNDQADMENNGFDILGESSEEDEPAPETPTENPGPAINNTLASLARERELRKQGKKNGEKAKPMSAKAPKKKKPRPQRLGGNKPTPAKVDKLDHIEDDMAFLDAQIEQVQTSHGRKVSGSGSKYRTVVNGILSAKPAPLEKKRNAQAQSSLQSKLKESQNSRKSKSKKK